MSRCVDVENFDIDAKSLGGAPASRYQKYSPVSLNPNEVLRFSLEATESFIVAMTSNIAGMQAQLAVSGYGAGTPVRIKTNCILSPQNLKNCVYINGESERAALYIKNNLGDMTIYIGWTSIYHANLGDVKKVERVPEDATLVDFSESITTNNLQNMQVVDNQEIMRGVFWNLRNWRFARERHEERRAS